MTNNRRLSIVLATICCLMVSATGCKKAPGEECSKADNCEEGLVCLDNKCFALQAAGQECKDAAQCQQGLVCLDARCFALADPGGACNKDEECKESLSCVKGKCFALQEPGGKCIDGEECKEGLICLESACFSPRNTGEECTNVTQCAPDLFCIEGACGPKRNEGEACAVDISCVDGLKCLDDACFKLRQEGEDCSQPAHCVAGLTCLKQVCFRLGNKGEACAGTPECSDGLVCQELKCIPCQEGVPCKRYGLCTLSERKCTAAGNDCTGCDLCLNDGKCAPQDGSCVADSDEACAASKSCKKEGRCAVKEGQCAPTSKAHCANSADCASSGKCTPADGVCAAVTLADCRASEGCKVHGRCSLLGNECFALLGAVWDTAKQPPHDLQEAAEDAGMPLLLAMDMLHEVEMLEALTKLDSGREVLFDAVRMSHSVVKRQVKGLDKLKKARVKGDYGQCLKVALKGVQDWSTIMAKYSEQACRQVKKDRAAKAKGRSAGFYDEALVQRMGGILLPQLYIGVTLNAVSRLAALSLLEDPELVKSLDKSLVKMIAALRKSAEKELVCAQDALGGKVYWRTSSGIGERLVEILAYLRARHAPNRLPEITWSQSDFELTPAK